MELHPVMYVADQYAERAFYELFGFVRTYEGLEFPGFLAVRHGDAVIGLQRADADHPAYTTGLRWQFEVATAEELDDVVAVCVQHGLAHDDTLEIGGDRFRTRCVTVRSPGA